MIFVSPEEFLAGSWRSDVTVDVFSERTGGTGSCTQPGSRLPDEAGLRGDVLSEANELVHRSAG